MYRIKTVFNEDNSNTIAHEITEEWQCKTKNELKKILCNALDLQTDKKGFPAKPDLKKLNEALKPYADKTFIAAEGKRMKAAYKIYVRLMKKLESSPKESICSDIIDDNTVVTVVKVS